VVNGDVVDDSWFAYVCGMDEGDDPLEGRACWLKANPLLGVTITLRYLRELVREARGMPAKASIVLRLNFCVWVDAANPAIDREIWMACQHDFEYEELAGVEPVGALDLSGVRDLTALALFWPGDTPHIAVEFWTPKEGLLERAKRDAVPWDLWVDQEHITATPGRAIDYRWVAVRLGELQQEVGLHRLAFDPYRIKYLERALDEEGVELELVPHGQGFYKAAESGLWMPHSIEVFEKLLGSGGRGSSRTRRSPSPRPRPCTRPIRRRTGSTRSGRAGPDRRHRGREHGGRIRRRRRRHDHPGRLRAPLA
jgi:phage terminase large subunit-like protein